MTQTQEDRFLQKLYELTEANNPDCRNMFSIGKRLGYDEPLVQMIVKHLNSQGLIGGVGLGPGLYITPKGKVQVREIDVNEHTWAYLKRLYEWTESKDPRGGNTMNIGESLDFDPDLIEVVVGKLRDRGYVRLSLGHGIRLTNEGIVKARDLE